METALWKNFNPGEINEKIQYWVDAWDDLIDHFTKNHYGLDLINPHVLLITLIDEIENNELRNSDNKKYLIEAIGKARNEDTIINDHIKVEFSSILKSFTNCSLTYLLQTTKHTLQFFQKGEYFRLTCDSLFECLKNIEWHEGDEEKIKLHSSSLIIELILKGHTLKSIRKIPRDIFSNNLLEFSDDRLTPQWLGNPPKTIDLFYPTIEDRLDLFPRIFFRIEPTYTFIFEVEGLKGDSEIQLGPVLFYSPRKRRILKSDDSHLDKAYEKAERFEKEGENYFANCAVSISSVDFDAAASSAADLAEKALELIRSFFRTNVKLRVIREQFVALRDGELAGSTRGLREDDIFLVHHGSLRLDFITGNGDSRSLLEKTSKFLFSTQESPLKRKISDCIRWYKKGEESLRMEDRLLYYWIVIEKIFTFPGSSAPLLKDSNKIESKIFLITELLSASYAYSFIFRIGWDLHSYLVTQAVNDQFRTHEKILNLSPAEIRACFLDETRTGTIHLKEFLESLPIVRDSTKKRIVQNKLDYTQRFYADANFAASEIEKTLEETRIDIILIYRYRNSIVHNAHYDPNLLKPFVEKAANLAQLALHMIQAEESQFELHEVDQIFVSRHVELAQMLERLKNNIPVTNVEFATWNNIR